MQTIDLYIEAGQKRTFAGAVDWPGWCRSGRDEAAAVEALLDYGPRYAKALAGQELGFRLPVDASALVIGQRLAGSASTDFGAPAAIPEADREPFGAPELARAEAILAGCWRALDEAAAQAVGHELRKGPRGGGRDLDKILVHVQEADLAYLPRLAWKHKRQAGATLPEALAETRRAVLAALASAAEQGLPEKGPRGGAIWPARYFVRRVAWHTLDHAWEIEDRVE